MDRIAEALADSTASDLDQLQRVSPGGRRLRRGDGLQAPLQRGPPPVRHRLQPVAGPARHRLLRPAGLGGVPDQLPGRRPRRRAAASTGSSSAGRSPRRRPDRPALLGRHDVRVPDAAAAAPAVARHAARREPHAAAVARQIEYGRQCGVPGASPSRPSTSSTPTSTTSTRRSACPAWASSAAWRSDLVIAPYATALAVDDPAACGAPELPPAGRRGGRGRLRLLRGHRLHARPAAARAAAASWSAASWPTTRG